MLNEKRPSFLASNQQFISKRLLLLIVFLCLTLIAMLAIAISTLKTSHNEYLSRTQNLEMISENQAAEISLWLEKIKGDVSTLASYPQFKQMNSESASAVIDNYAKEHKDHEALFIAGTDGKTIVSDDGVVRDLSDRAYYQDAMSGYTVYSEPLLSRATRHVVIVVSAPIMKENQVVGVIGLIFPITQFQQALSAAQPGETGEVYLIDSNGMMITSSRFNAQLLEQGLMISQSELELVVQTYASDQIAAQQSGSGRYKNYLNQPVFGSFRFIPDTGWGIVVEQQEAEIQSKVLPPRILAVLFFLLSAIDGSLIVLLLVVFIMNSRKKAEGTTGQISAS